MKLFLHLVTLFFFQNLFCQEYQYHFDTFLEYKGVKDGTINSYFLNSTNDSYFLNISHGSETMYGTVRDFKNTITHKYEAIQSDNIINFNYLYSRKIHYNYYENYVFNITEKAIDSTKKEFKIIVFENKKQKKINCNIDLIVENSNAFFPNDFLNYFTHNRLSNSGFKIEKGILSKIKFKFRNGHEYEYILTKNQRINTLLSIGKEQIQYRQ